MQYPAIQKQGILLQALVGYFVQKILTKLYNTVKKKLKKYAIENLSNQFVLRWMAERDSDPEIRASAANKVISIKTLRSLLAKEKDFGIKKIILSRLPISDTIQFYNRAKSKYKKEILSQIKTQDALYQVARSENDTVLLGLIFQRLTDPEKIELLRKHPLLEVRNWVDKKLWEIKRKEKGISKKIPALLKAVLSTKELNPHLVHLLGWIRQPKLWYSIAIRHPNPEVRNLAVRNLETNKSILGKLAINKKVDENTRLAAMRLLREGLTITDLARTDPSPMVRMQAIALLDPKRDSDTITLASKYERNSEVLSQVVIVTQNPSDLKIIRERVNPKRFPHLLDIVSKREETLLSLPMVAGVRESRLHIQ